MKRCYIIHMHSHSGASMGCVGDPTKKGVIEKAAEQMPWLAKTDIAKMVITVPVDY